MYVDIVKKVQIRAVLWHIMTISWENGVNPKRCTIRDDDGEMVADDFPPDYNYLQDYVYEIVSSYDFIESPDKCTVKIADAFKRNTKKIILMTT